MRSFDQGFITDTLGRLEALLPDAQPQWGTMTAPEMVTHLAFSLRFSLGQLPEVPVIGGLVGHWIVAPLVLNGIIKLPRNIKGAQWPGETEAKCDVDAVRDEFHAFYDGTRAGVLAPPPHPFFGDIGPRGWTKLHVVHTDHHLRQFGI